MNWNFFSLFDSNERQIKKLQKLVEKVLVESEVVESWPDERFKEQTELFKSQLAQISNPEIVKQKLDEFLPLAYAMVREAAYRTLGLKHYEAQIMAGIVGHQGKIFEQKTGEGKTLTATLPLYLNSLTGNGVHSVTVNDYLTRRDCGWNGPIFNFLGVSISCITHELSEIFDESFLNENVQDSRMKHLREVSRADAYKADVTYGTTSQFGFDYLRDNMARDLTHVVGRNHYFALVDEIDSILIDEARTPLIISSPAQEATEKYGQFATLASKLQPNTDYEIEEKERRAFLTELGLRKIENQLGVTNIYEEHFDVVHHLENALKAETLFIKDKDYVVKDGEVVIVDEHTGRLMFGRRYSDGIHQAIEAKEKLVIQRESSTLASITIQNYFRMYEKLAGMTGTALTEAEEFYKIYKLEVISIPTHFPLIRKDQSDVIFFSQKAKYKAIVDLIEEKNAKGQPVLVGTTSIQKNELLHELLNRKGIKHQLLNAKNHEREAEIISQAGKYGAITLATNIAGRGVDIELGGVGPKKYEGEVWAEEDIERWKKEHQKVKDAGGLFVLGTERHESRRIDNQLRGRSGRQGDPGETRFFLALDDDLMRIFGGERFIAFANRFKVMEDQIIESSLVSKNIESAQSKVEGANFDIRKSLVEYDDVNNKQREVVYKMRLKVLEALKEENVNSGPDLEVSIWLKNKLAGYIDDIESFWTEKEDKLGSELWARVLQQITLDNIDTFWIEHLESLQDIRSGIHLRGRGQLDPKVEYQKEARVLFDKMISEIFYSIAERLKQIKIEEADEVNYVSNKFEEEKLTFSSPEMEATKDSKKMPIESAKIGRNDLCHCGSGKKYKHCHGKA